MHFLQKQSYYFSNDPRMYVMYVLFVTCNMYSDNVGMVKLREQVGLERHVATRPLVQVPAGNLRAPRQLDDHLRRVAGSIVYSDGMGVCCE